MPSCTEYWMRCMRMNKEGTCKGMCPCDTECPIGAALSAIGGRWKMRIICTLFVDGTQRYNDLVRKTTGITNAMLSSSLKELERDGLIHREMYPEIPPKVEYTLTERGHSLVRVLDQLCVWGEENRPKEL